MKYSSLRIPGYAFLTLLLLLTLRLIADVYHFPFTDEPDVPLSRASVFEIISFYLFLNMLVLSMFRIQQISADEAAKFSIFIMFVYLWVHLLELVFETGSRAAYYPPNDHFWSNLLTAFIQTGDAGFWQIFRIFFCAILMTTLVLAKRIHLHERIRLGQWMLTMLFAYLIVMAVVHKDLWMYTPIYLSNSSQMFALLSQDGFFIDLRTAYILLVFVVLFRVMMAFLSKSAFGPLSSMYKSWLWTALFLFCILFTPLFVDRPTVLTAYLQGICMLVIKLSLDTLQPTILRLFFNSNPDRHNSAAVAPNGFFPLLACLILIASILIIHLNYGYLLLILMLLLPILESYFTLKYPDSNIASPTTLTLINVFIHIVFFYLFM